MRDYHLHQLTGEDHENLVIRICRDLLGIGVINFSEGKDGGRDAKFVGKAQRYPSEVLPWEGTFIIQSKRVGDPSKSCSDPDFKTSLLKKEIPKIKALRDGGECDAYMIFTNRKLTGIKESELVNYLSVTTQVPKIAILGVETISSWLTEHPSIVTACGLDIFRGPLRIHPRELRDLILGFHKHWPSIIQDAEAKYSLEYVEMKRKNELNALTESYFDYIDENSTSYFHIIDKFLSNPLNNDLLDYYYTIVDELKSKIAASRDIFVKFDEVFVHIYDYVSESIPELRPKRRLINVFLHYMYCKCDIGKKK